MLPPRVVVAAPSSGSGKTTITTGLLGALRRRGTAVAPFKVGPDYVDPGYHALAAGRPGRNLDPVMVGAERLPGLVVHGAAGAELAVVEGVMGLFDGRLAQGGDGADGSTAHVARVLDAPVVLVVDARGQSRSVAALVSGFRSFDPRVRVAAVVLNRVGTARHEQAMRDACAEVGVPVLGAVPRHAELAVPSRHLGLVTAAEHGDDARAAVDAMAELVATHVDLAAVVDLARRAPATPAAAWDPAREVAAAVPTERHHRSSLSTDGAPRSVESDAPDSDRGAPRPVPPTDGALRSERRRPVIAVAGGPAFTFGYPEHGELLAAAGAEVVTVDPLRDEELPEGVTGLVLPGGFPEEHLDALSANAALRDAVRRFAAAGGAVHAECGGLLYLARSLDGAPMCGVLPADAAMSPRLHLGYRSAAAVVDSPVAAAGETVTGHEFHRTTVTPRAGTTPAWRWDDAGEGFVDGPTGAVHASYLHTHPAGRPASVVRFAHVSARGCYSDPERSHGRSPQ